jgi:hypothetical protein
MYSVSVNGKWTNERTFIESFEDKGFKVQQSRLVGDMDVFYDGILVAHLFEHQADQIHHLKAKGFI